MPDFYADPVAARLNEALTKNWHDAWQHEVRGHHGEWASGTPDYVHQAEIEHEIYGHPLTPETLAAEDSERRRYAEMARNTRAITPEDVEQNAWRPLLQEALRNEMTRRAAQRRSPTGYMHAHIPTRSS